MTTDGMLPATYDAVPLPYEEGTPVHLLVLNLVRRNFTNASPRKLSLEVMTSRAHPLRVMTSSSEGISADDQLSSSLVPEYAAATKKSHGNGVNALLGANCTGSSNSLHLNLQSRIDTDVIYDVVGCEVVGDAWAQQYENTFMGPLLRNTVFSSTVQTVTLPPEIVQSPIKRGIHHRKVNMPQLMTSFSRWALGNNGFSIPSGDMLQRRLGSDNKGLLPRDRELASYYFPEGDTPFDEEQMLTRSLYGQPMTLLAKDIEDQPVALQHDV